MSVTGETALAARRIPVGVPARPGDLDLADLVVSSDGERLIVWSRRLDRRVRPVLYSRIAPQLLPPVARFLAAAGHCGERPWHCWSWRQTNAAFTPAVRYRDIWLAPARWVVPPHLIAAATDAVRWETALAAWRVTTAPRPPDRVLTDNGDRRLMLDLQRADDRALLRRYVRRGLTALTAPAGDATTSRAVVTGPGGRHLLELVVCLDRAAAAPVTVSAAPPVRPAGQGYYLPGGAWLSFCVQAPAFCHEQVLRSLTAQVAAVAGRWDRWFWLRYRDDRHGEQLRIRFHTAPADGGALLAAMSQWATVLRGQRLISGFCVEPYDQEIERYGGATAISAAERFFTADSELALTLLSATRHDPERLVAAARCAAAIAARIGGWVLPRGRLDRPTHRHLQALRPRVRAAADPWHDSWQTTLDAYATVLDAQRGAQVASDLIHMHCNRLAPAHEDLIYALAADLNISHPQCSEEWH
jgi:thiopeptide-type bacteriocin biosynthesis protein